LTWVDSSFLQIGGALTALVLVGLWSHMRRRRLLAAYLGGRAAMRRFSRSDLRRFGLRRTLLLSLGGAALTVAAAEPRWTPETLPEPEPVVKRVILAIDVSASMQAEDAAPTRLGAASEVARQVLDSLAGHEVGLVLFAGKAYPLAPPTRDHEAIRFLLGGVTPRIASAQDPGTLLSVAIRESAALLDRTFTTPSDPVRETGGAASSPSALAAAGATVGSAAATSAASATASPDASPGGRPGQRVVVLIGDGDIGEREDDVRAALADARASGVEVHAIAVGTAAGAGMIMPPGTYQLGGRVVDANGRPGVSRLRDGLLREIAQSGGGRYAHAAVPEEVASLQLALADVGPAPEAVVDLSAPAWARYDVPFVLGSVALALVVLESLLGMSLPKPRFRRSARTPVLSQGRRRRRMGAPPAREAA
jgi:hypothetical protein